MNENESNLIINSSFKNLNILNTINNLKNIINHNVKNLSSDIKKEKLKDIVDNINKLSNNIKTYESESEGEKDV